MHRQTGTGKSRCNLPGLIEPAKRPRALLVLFALTAIAACAVVPTHEVLPYPDHISAGVAVGDRLRVTTRNGTTREIEVTALTEDALVTSSETISFENIKRITKQSWSPPDNPCDDNRPLGCSIHPAVRAVSEMHAEYARELRLPCSQHDYCYRYGYQTYGLERDECDALFLDEMQALCNTEHQLDIIERSECLSIAAQMHSAVAGFGEQYFHKDAYCEYAGPPAHVLWK